MIIFLNEIRGLITMPIFISDETGKCFGLMNEKEKNTVSHRAKALNKLLTYLKINGFVPL